MKLPGGVTCLALALGVSGCKGEPPEISAAHAVLGGDIVARVAEVDLPASLVGAVALARAVEPTTALALLIDDVVAAKGAEARHLADTPSAHVARRSVLARATIDRIRLHSRTSPPTEEEVLAASTAHWLEVNVPETRVVVHAVVLRSKDPDPAADAVAREVAAAIAATEADAVDVDDFQARARAVPARGAKVVIETLEPFAAGGRIAAAGAPRAYDPKFAAGADLLLSAGATSGVVESSFGWHVIRLIELRPPANVPLDERRRRFAREIEDHRAHEALEALEARLHAERPVVIANGIDDLLAGAMPALSTSSDAPAL